jgi:hypothetical protein
MSKKRKEEGGQDTYEVWSFKTDGTWKQIAERGNEGIFGHKPRALLIAQNESSKEGVVETLVIQRRPIASFNGPAISLKGRINAAIEKQTSAEAKDVPEPEEKKKEEPAHAPDVHGDRPEEGHVADPGHGHPGEAGVPRPAGEADPA